MFRLHLLPIKFRYFYMILYRPFWFIQFLILKGNAGLHPIAPLTSFSNKIPSRIKHSGFSHMSP